MQLTIERRNALRQRSLLQGRVFFNNGRSSIDCMIRDISATGAKLAFSSAVETPARVELQIPNKGETYSAKVAWRRGDEMGVTFLAPDAPEQEDNPGVAREVLARLHQLEQEMAQAKATIEELRAELRRLAAER